MENIYQVDAFTDAAFAGNPAAVCVLSGDKSDQWLQSVAMEMNLAETAFVWPRGRHFHIRWFTPDMEEELCGHATLASSHILWEQGYVDSGAALEFDSRSGRLGASRTADGAIELDFPAEPAVPCALPPELPGILGFSAASVYFTGRNRLDYLLEIPDHEVLRRLKPDFAALREFAAADPFRGVIVTAGGGSSGYDCVSRFFSTEPTIPEDPVTGSAHCCIGPYWKGKTGKHELLAFQASSRGGVLRLGISDARVRLGGQAVTVFKGQLLV
ncbi:MAG: PhzF family phenazine biosynthesis protein [Spirochaetes bacterium]|nr:PhzF family phenazine biosynthesis protein [Spirochaetota bacterium]